MGYCKCMEDDWDFWTDNQNNNGASAYWESIRRCAGDADAKEREAYHPAKERRTA